MNRMNSRNDFDSDDSTINIVVFVIMQLLLYSNQEKNAHTHKIDFYNPRAMVVLIALLSTWRSSKMRGHRAHRARHSSASLCVN